MSWTDERINTLKKMWGAGKSASEIAEKLGGVTRNAVIGKAHRLGLSGRPSPIKKVAPKKAASAAAAPAKKAAAPKPVAAPKPKAAPAPVKRAAPAPVKAAPVSRAPVNAPGKPPEIIQLAALANASSQPDGSIISILELNERTCRWPVGDPKDPAFGYCGSPVYAAHPYCAEHVAIAFQAPNRKDKKPSKNLKDTEIEDDLDDIEVEIEDDDTDTGDDTLTDDLDDDDTPVVV